VLLHYELVAGGAWFAFDTTDNELLLNGTVFEGNTASCCFAQGYGAAVQTNASLTDMTCEDIDSGTSKASLKTSIA
jgi:hypothetical protein